MTLRLNGSTSGFTEIDAPAVAGSNTLRLPTGNGSDGNILGTDGAGNLSWVNGRMVLETAKTATGTSVDFTGIPSWVKKITIMFNGVSTNGTSNVVVRLGTSGGVTASGYLSGTGYIYVIANNTQAFQETTGFLTCVSGSPAMVFSGALVFTNLSSNTWVAAGTLYRSDAGQMHMPSGTVTLSGTLDRLRLTTVNGTDAFDAGSVNILYEG
jgi:hypothetical protein